jgi:general stress protein YciG
LIKGLRNAIIAPGGDVEVESQDKQKIFEAAKNGGDYSKTYKSLDMQDDEKLVKSLNSFKTNVTEHLEKISNPKENAKDIDWNNTSENYKQGLIAKWKKDIKRNDIFAAIAEGILKERGK